ncbi:MAG: polyketide synthase, partial [bacterium]|nr:polyketide synthase [bacterium]
FQYNTPQRVISYFREQMSMPEEQKAGLPKPGSKTSQISVKRKKDAPGYPLGAKDNGIAVIGMSCRLPGGISSPQGLWDFLKNGKNAIGRMPEGRWSWPVDIDPQHEHPGIDRGGFLKDVECFDAAFFRLSPKEVEVMDPQQRILLELAWEALEDCGYCADALSNSRTGVFIGASGSDYRLVLEQKHLNVEAHMGTGNSMAVLANRISYFYDFHGPSLQIDTACSSSLVAVHEAVQALESGKCAQALVGGVNIICHPANTIAYYK